MFNLAAFLNNGVRNIRWFFFFFLTANISTYKCDPLLFLVYLILHFDSKILRPNN